MPQSDYMSNMQKILYIAKELHNRGFENLRIIPTLSPSGLSWRCKFISTTNPEKDNVIASSWLVSICYNQQENLKLSIEALTDLFVREHSDFLDRVC